jgi:hypothetical protein
LNIIAVLIVFYQNLTIVLYITIPVAVDANHSVVGHFDSDARASSHDVGGGVVNEFSMAEMGGFCNPPVDSSETVHRVFQHGQKTIKILRRRKNRDHSVDQIRTVIFPKFVQVVFPIGVTVLSVNAHGEKSKWSGLSTTNLT